MILKGVLAPAAEQLPQEFQLKAVLLWRLAQFVDWPSNAFESAESPIVIGVIGRNPFGDALESVVAGETAHGRKLVVEYYRAVTQIKTCHVLFICQSEVRRVKSIVEAVADRSILTVSDLEGFTRLHDGMIRFLPDQNRIKLLINPDLAAQAGLTLDARLLRMAEIVRKP